MKNTKTNHKTQTKTVKQIKITHNLDLLARHGGEAYADEHAGVTYTVESVDPEGWAHVRGVNNLGEYWGAKFHPCCFRFTRNPIAMLFHDQRHAAITEGNA
jgi:hypothetical protein